MVNIMAKHSQNPTQPETDHSRPIPARVSEECGLLHRLFSPVDIGLLVFFRIAFGGIMFWEMMRFCVHDWVQTHFIDPEMHFTYYGFGWVHPWPGIGMHVHVYVLAALALSIVLGLFYRVATVLFCLGITYLFLIDQALYLNHLYLICLVSFLLIFIPAHRIFSLDVLRNPQIRSETAPAWTLWILRGQVGMAYFFGGIAKLDTDWLSGQPMRMMLARRADRFPIISEYMLEDATVYFFAYGGLLFDLLIVPLLLWRRTRVAAYVLAVLFNMTNNWMFNIGIFPVMMIVGTLLYFPPERLRDRRKAANSGVAAAKSPLASSPPRPLQLATAAFLSVYILVQVLVPFRHFLYPGNVNWTEEGHRFSWHMKLRVKRAFAEFFAYDREGRQLAVAPLDTRVTSRQLRVMPGRPDMVLQYSHFLFRELDKQDRDPYAIQAVVQVSLNGRVPQLLIDPNVNLAAQARNLRHAEWIVPLTEPLPTNWTPPPIE